MILPLVLTLLLLLADAIAQTYPGGFVEDTGSASRARMTTAQINAFMPATRSGFTFPSPYFTKGYRITIPSDCGGQDCVMYVGYSYWMRMNNHVNDSVMYIVMALNTGRGGAGATLFQLNKVTGTVSRVRNLFPTGDARQSFSLEHWYFSYTLPYAMYYTDLATLKRYDVVSQITSTVVDIFNRNYTDANGTQISLGCTTANGCPRRLFHFTSSADDTVHVGTLNDLAGNPIGCVVYRAPQNQFRFYPPVGIFDECLVDRTGQYTVTYEDIGTPGDHAANRIFDNTTGQLVMQKSGPSGTLGHSAMGYGYALGMDNNGSVPPFPQSTTRMDFPNAGTNTLLHYNNSTGATWDMTTFNHPTHSNAVPTSERSLSNQYFCGSDANTTYSKANEIMCARADGIAPLKQLVVAPVMTDPNASGGFWNNGAYGLQPKGHLDVTGRYFLWTTNLGGNRLDAILVEVPGHLLVQLSQDQTPPASPTGVRVQ